MDQSVYVGNANVDAPGDRGWLLGHFKPVGDVRHSEDVEIKWYVHPAGDERGAWVRGEHRTALLILISGGGCVVVLPRPQGPSPDEEVAVRFLGWRMR